MEVICFTISDGECKSITRLWMRISYLSQVLVPSPFGALRVVIRKFLVGRRTGPETFKFFCWALFFKSAQTFSRFFTFLDVRVIRIRKILESSDSKVLAFIMLDMFSDNTNAGRGLLVTDNYLILNMLELDFFDSFFLFLCCVSFKLALYCSK